MTLTTRTALIVATALGLAGAPTLAEAPKGDLALLQGSWTAKVGPDKDIPLTLVIKDDVAELTVVPPNGDEIKLKGKLKLDDQASPKTLDWLDFLDPQGNEIPKNLGLYKLDGDTWTTCNGGPGKDRPKKFEAGDGGDPSLVTWARVKTPGDKPSEKPIAGDLGKFQGTWTGKAGENREVSVTLTVKGNAVTASWDPGDGNAVEFKGEMRINELANPKTVDFFNFKRSDGEEAQDSLGLYAFDGDDRFRVQTGGPGNERPTELKSGDEGGPSFIVFARKKD